MAYENIDNLKYIFTNKQWFWVKRIREANLPMINLVKMSEILDYDLEAMYEYGILGQDIFPVYDNYDKVKGYVRNYLGALSVGVAPDDTDLLNEIKTLSFNGLVGEARIDELKQKAAYKYLYSDNYTNNRKGGLSSILKSYFTVNVLNAKMLSPEELQFWWELIPSDKYNDYGSKVSDVDVYYETAVDI